MGNGISKEVSNLAVAYSLKEPTPTATTNHENDLSTNSTNTVTGSTHNRISPTNTLLPRTDSDDDTIYEVGATSAVATAAAAAGVQEPSIANLSVDDLVLVEDEEEGSIMPVEPNSFTLGPFRLGGRALSDVSRLNKHFASNNGNYNSAGTAIPWNSMNLSESFWSPRSPSMLQRAGVGGKLGKDILTKKRVRAITFGQLPSLSTIGLSSQGLVKISSFIAFLHTTTTLQLCCNELTSLPDEIGYMRNLVVLSVTKNKLTSLPDTIGYLTKLVDLQASENQLASIPPSIGNLTKLTTLSLEANRIAHLPQEIGQLKNLINLDLSDNPLLILPAEIGRLKYLRRLRLDNCLLLSEITVDKSYSPPSLKELAARIIVRHQLPILEVMHDQLKQYLASAKKCSFCNGPFFDSFVIRGKMIEKNDIKVPLEYQLCIPHWTTEQERLLIMFARPPPETAPVDKLNKSIKQRKKASRSISHGSDDYSSSPRPPNTVPLSTLYNSAPLPPLPNISKHFNF